MKTLPFIFIFSFIFSSITFAQTNEKYFGRALKEEARINLQKNNIRGYADYTYKIVNGVREDIVRHFTLVQTDSTGNVLSIADFDGDRNFLTQRKFIYNDKNEKIAEFYIEEGRLKNKILYYYDLDNELIESVNMTDFGSVNERIKYYRNTKGLIKKMDIKGPTGSTKYDVKIKYNELNYPLECILSENGKTAFAYNYTYENKKLKSETIHVSKPENKIEKEYFSGGDLIDSVQYTDQKGAVNMIVRKHFTFGQKTRNIEKWLVIPDYSKYFKAENDFKDQFTYKTPPHFPGGKEALKRYIKEELKYPKKAYKAGIDGLVIVSFAIDPSGTVGNVRIVKSVDYDLENAAIELVKNMPKWKPALNEKEKETMSSFVLPVNFIIEE